VINEKPHPPLGTVLFFHVERRAEEIFGGWWQRVCVCVRGLLTVPVGIRSLVRDHFQIVSKPNRKWVRVGTSPPSALRFSVWGDNASCWVCIFSHSAARKGPDSQDVSGGSNMEREGREGENKGKFTGTHVLIGGFEMDRCEAMAGDEVIF
jgi:hypothetical protein